MSHMSRAFQSQRKALAEETLRILQEGGYGRRSGEWVDLQEPLRWSWESSFLLREKEHLPSGGKEAKSDGPLKVEVTGETSLEALYRLSQEDCGHLLLLNFASAKNPGGGFLNGAQAQEESLARSSGLYPCLMKFNDEMYAANRADPRGGFYSDDMIFSSHVPFFRTDQGSLIWPPVCCSVITSPAVNAGVVGEKASKGKGETKVMQVMEGRLQRILHLARSQHATTLILGAWGCGVFRNSPEDVAKLFARLLARAPFARSFRRAVFAVPDDAMKAHFAQALHPAGRQPQPAGDSAALSPEGYPASPEVVTAAVVTDSPSESPSESAQVVSIDLDEAEAELELKLVSFGYTRGEGIPVADHVFDARHIKNPQRGPQKHLTGLDARLRKEVMANEGAEEFYQKMLQTVLKDIASERSELVVAIGCARGKHRSVTFCEELAKALRGKSSGRKLAVSVWHREQGSWSKKGRWRQGRHDLPVEDDED